MFDWLVPWWPDWASFLQMGRHGPYVWGSIASCALLLIAEQIVLRRHVRRMQRED